MKKLILLLPGDTGITESWFKAPEFADYSVIRVENEADAMAALPPACLVCCGWPITSGMGAVIRESRRRAQPTLCVLQAPVAWADIALAPVDRVACVGRAQARQFELAGNQCEVVGDPSLDSYPPVAAHMVGDRGRPLVLLCLRDEKNALALSLLRRIAELGSALPAAFSRAAATPTMEELRNADIVIADDGAIIVKSMLLGRPCALLSEGSEPLPSVPAWRITSAESVETTIHDLLAPSVTRLAVQDTLLADALECRTPAGPRWVLLVNEICRFGDQARANKSALELPPRLVPRLRAGRAASADALKVIPSPTCLDWTEGDLRALIESGLRFARPYSQPPLRPENIVIRLWAVLPTSARIRSTLAVSLTVENQSHWGLRSVGTHPVLASYLWLDCAGNVVADGIRSRISIPPRTTARVWVRIVAPPTSGEYDLIITLVQEGLFWFHGINTDFQIRGRVHVNE